MKPDFQELIKIIKVNDPQADTTMIQLAFEFAAKAHEGQLRKSGEPYINHPLGAAIYLANLKVDNNTIIAALLHDVPEETKITLKEIKNNFGDEVANLVGGITKLGTLKYRGIERYAENLRRMFLAISQDVRVIFIKLADRLNNLQTLNALPHNKQLRIAKETLEIYAPIANRLGMGQLKGDLEDLAFPFVYPDDYKWLTKILPTKKQEQEIYLEDVKKILDKELTKNNIQPVSVHGRAKHLYSLCQKLLRPEYNRDISKIYDIVALRIIVKDIADCYATLGIVHSLWKPLPGRIKDYIAQPKPNGYQSIHTTVWAEREHIVEIQIRTQEMHEEAEYGITAHWQYVEKGKPQEGSRLSKQLSWVNEVLKWQKEIKDSEKYLEAIKLEVFPTRIFVFTPNGDVIDLPEGATPIDFAFHIHTDIGMHCVGAKINEQLVGLDTVLKSGDMIEIIIDKHRKTPNPDWLKFAKTSAARSKIKSSAKIQDYFNEAWETAKGLMPGRKKK
ncbi:MAG: RelA/SpoT family protein [Candidatus Buchananbacteria bacterium]